MSTSTKYRPLKVGEKRQFGYEFKRKGNKLWRPGTPSNIGRPVTLRLARQFEFRRPL